MNTDTNTLSPLTEKMQVLLSAALHLPVILCPKDEPPHKGELKHMSIYELREFFRHVRNFFDLYVQDAESGAPVKLNSVYNKFPTPEDEIYYFPVRKCSGEAAPYAGADSPAAAYVLHGDTLIQHPHSQEWLPLADISESATFPFGEGQLVMQPSPACTQKLCNKKGSSPHPDLPDICKLTFARHCTLHLVVGQGQAEPYSLLVRGQSVPPPEPAPEPQTVPGKKKKQPHKKTKRKKKKSKALPHLPLPNRYQDPSRPITWQEVKEYLYELFSTGDSPACMFCDFLDAHDYPELANLVNYTPQH